MLECVCHPSFAPRGIWTNRAKGRVLRDPTIARFDRFLTRLSRRIEFVAAFSKTETF